jgi:flagellar export protein FliJ
MKPFRFSLQPLRVLREQKEQTAQQRYAEALRVCETAAERVRIASNELAANWKLLRDTMSAGVTGLDLLRTRAWCNVLELRLKERTGILEKARLAVDAVWREMMNATRDREALDHYYDKCRRAHDRVTQREEQKRLDELALRPGRTPSVLRVPRAPRMEMP